MKRKMTKQEAIETLSTLVARIPPLEKQKSFSEDFQKWQHDGHAALKHIFPSEKEYLREYDDISYTLSVFYDGTPDSEFEEAFRSGLQSARAMLESRIDEIRQFWPDAPARDPVKSEFGLGLEVKSVEVSKPPTNPEDVFVIHGRQLLGDFHDFIRALGLKPLEWSQARNFTGKTNPYTWEVVDTALSTAGAIVALLTPDDEARLKPHLWSEHENALEKEFLSQPRQNVLFEAGVAYGRAPSRTLLVRVGSHRPMSDLAGHHILQLDDSPQSRQDVADALRVAGCPVNVSGRDWFRAGKFSLADQPVRTAGTEQIGRGGLQPSEHASRLLLFKTRLKGYTDLPRAATVVELIHHFFFEHPQYLHTDANRLFLEKYGADFKVKALGYSFASQAVCLEDLKRDVESLCIDDSSSKQRVQSAE